MPATMLGGLVMLTLLSTASSLHISVASHTRTIRPLSIRLPIPSCDELRSSLTSRPDVQQKLELDKADKPFSFASRQGIRAIYLPALIAVLLVAVGVSGRVWLLRAYRIYEEAAIARPIITKSLTSAVAYAIGDSMAQKLEQRKAKRIRGSSPVQYDGARNLRSAIAGLVSHGPQ